MHLFGDHDCLVLAFVGIRRVTGRRSMLDEPLDVGFVEGVEYVEEVLTIR